MIFNARTSGSKSGAPNLGLVLPSPGAGVDSKRERPNNKNTPRLIKRAERLKDRAVNVVDKVTDAPNKLRKKADDLTDMLIGVGNDLKNQASGKAEKNLTKGKIESIGSDASRWLSTGYNWAYALGAVAVVIWFVMKGGK